MKKLICLMSVIAVLGFSPEYAFSVTAPGKQLPAGFQVRQSRQGGSGYVLTTKQIQGRTPAEVLVRALDRLSGYFEGRPQIVAGFQDKRSGSGQGTFMARMGGHVIKGVAVVQMTGRNAGATIFYDRADRLARSFPQMTASPEGRGAKSAVKLHTVRLPDGSGTVRLPDGWRITGAHKGMMDAVGPDGCAVAFGIALPINVPGRQLRVPGSERLFWASYAPPAEAIFTVNREMRRTRGQSGDSKLRLIEQHPTPPPMRQGKASFLHFTYESDLKGRKVTYRSLAWVATAPTGSSSWMYYFSQVAAPDSVFAKQLPAMMEIWKSWKVSDRVYQERLNDALANMREMGRITESVAERREQAMADAHYNWIEYIRDERMMKDTKLDTFSTESLHYVDKLVDKLNEKEGYNRYEELPLREYYRTR